RLYDVLHEEERAKYLAGIVAELKPYVLSLPEGSTIVEVGCGPGRILLGLASDADIITKGHRFEGYDPSPEMIVIAEEKLVRIKGLRHISFRVGSSSDPIAHAVLPQSSLLICRNVLSWLSDAEADFEIWSRLLPLEAIIYIRDLRRDMPF